MYHKLWLDDVQFLRYGAWQTDGQTDERMKKVTYRDGCLKIDNINRQKWMLLARWLNIYNCLLENFQAPIYKNLLLTKCRAYWAFRANHHLYDLIISLVLQTACSYPENPLNRNNYKVIKSFRRIMSFKSYQVSQCH